MDQLPLEAFFETPSRNLAELVYRYRLLYFLASQEPLSAPSQRSFPGAKRLAAQLGLNRVERLKQLFKNLGMGILELAIDRKKITAELTPELPASLQFGTKLIICELERCLIQASLELIVGLPVVLSHIRCWSSGADTCRFEAFRDSTSHMPMYLPRPPAPANGSKADADFSRTEAGNADDQLWLKSWHLGLLNKEFARAKRQGRHLAALYIDLDDLGEINTVFGRTAGDEAISVVDAALKHNCRAEDFLWHAGEDEFVVILPETDLLEAEAVAGRLAASIRAEAQQTTGTAISVSIGVAVYPDHASDPDGLIESAHSALYLAKSKGKGQALAMIPSVTNLPQAEKLCQANNSANSSSFFKKPAAKPKFGHLQIVREDGAITSQEEEAQIIDKKQCPRVIIACSRALILAGIEQVLRQTDFQTVAKITQTARLCAAVDNLRPELIIVDQQMAIADASALPRLLNSKNLPCKLIVLANEIDQPLVKLVVDYAIDGVILEKHSAEDIAKMLAEIYRGKRYLPTDVRTASKKLKKCRRLLSELSQRELDVLKLVAQGKSNSQISERLYITVNTVRFHLANVYQKLGVSNRTEAANYFLRQDLYAGC